jgi:hypothetical protein
MKGKELPTHAFATSSSTTQPLAKSSRWLNWRWPRRSARISKLNCRWRARVANSSGGAVDIPPSHHMPCKNGVSGAMQYSWLTDDHCKAWRLIHSKRLRGHQVNLHHRGLVVWPQGTTPEEELSRWQTRLMVKWFVRNFSFAKLLFTHFPVYVVWPHAAKRAER